MASIQEERVTEMSDKVTIGSRWVRLNDPAPDLRKYGGRVFAVCLIEGGTVYLVNRQGRTSLIPMENFLSVWGPAPDGAGCNQERVKK